MAAGPLRRIKMLTNMRRMGREHPAITSLIDAGDVEELLAETTLTALAQVYPPLMPVGGCAPAQTAADADEDALGFDGMRRRGF